MTKLPPIEKVYEAWSAIADRRVHIIDEGQYTVDSSDGERTYNIRYNAATDTYSSDDNATFWRGYAGYPVIAVMMLQGRLPYQPADTIEWADINWNELNKRYKRDYAAAVKHVEEQRHIDAAKAKGRAEEVMTALTTLPAKVKRYKG